MAGAVTIIDLGMAMEKPIQHNSLSMVILGPRIIPDSSFD
jgi:hypothetical protein